MHGSIDQGLVSPTLLGYATKVKSLIDSAFLFEVSYDSYFWTDECMRQSLAFMAHEVGSVMCYHHCQKIHGHVNNGYWELIPCRKVPEGVKHVPSVWAIHRQIYLITYQVIKYKSHLKLHDGQQELGVNCIEIYAPVAT